MTKEITKAYIMQQLTDLFGLRELTPDVFRLLETVHPVYDIGDALRTRILTYVEKSITGSGNWSFFTVPNNERWFFDRYDIVFMGAGAYTVAGANITRAQSGIVSSIYLDLTAGQTVSYHVGLRVPVVMDPGDTFHINVDGYTSTQHLRVYLDYTKETLR